jgi:hypothetical protein
LGKRKKLSQSDLVDEMKNIDLNSYTYPKKLVDLVKNKFPYLIIHYGVVLLV